MFYIYEYYSIRGSVFDFYDYNKTPFDFAYYVDRNKNKWQLFLILPGMMQFFIGIVASCRAYFALQKNGIAQDVRSSVIKMHTIIVITFFVCNVPVVAANSLSVAAYFKILGLPLEV